MSQDRGPINVYELRNALWQTGQMLFDSPSIRDRRYAELLVNLGYIVADPGAQGIDTNAGEAAIIARLIGLVEHCKTVKV